MLINVNGKTVTIAMRQDESSVVRRLDRCAQSNLRGLRNLSPSKNAAFEFGHSQGFTLLNLILQTSDVFG